MFLGEQDINMRVLQMIRNEHIKVMKCYYAPKGDQNTSQCAVFFLLVQYGVPVIKYDRNGFKPRPRQLVLTQRAAHVIEEANIKQTVPYTSLKGEGNVTSCISPTGMFLY